MRFRKINRKAIFIIILTDIEIAQYIKSEGQDWELTNLHPEKCLEKN